MASAAHLPDEVLYRSDAEVDPVKFGNVQREQLADVEWDRIGRSNVEGAALTAVTRQHPRDLDHSLD
jgi:hypothetical protein